MPFRYCCGKVTLKVFTWPATWPGAGATVIFGVAISDQLTSEPTLFLAESVRTSFQTPSSALPLSVESVFDPGE